ncbi:MAG: hypothetical protein GX958_08610 [Desulfitobacterium sp.]|nr:hypothetical protein [Desulfitobacterium sp.]
MGRLSIYLPPFTGDYSGVCSALFDFNCLIVLCDASCCTKNYINYDEPRWSRNKTTTLCAQLRTMEVALGDDSRIINQTIEAAQALKPDFIALLGSPVPAIIGMDMKGMAREVEERTGIPALGFDTTGFVNYHRGVSSALVELFRRFSDPHTPKIPRSVNLLGLTPLDLGAVGNADALRAVVEDAGFSVVCNFLMDSDLEDLCQSPGASVNLVITSSGLALAREMEEALGIPYVIGMPIGTKQTQAVIDLLEESMKKGISQIPSANNQEGNEGLLILGDQIIANSIRNALQAMGCTRPVVVSSFFELEPALSAPADIRLEKEADLIRALQSGSFSTVLGDPLLHRIPQMASLELIPLPHPVISGRLHWDEVPLFTGEDMQKLLHRAINPPHQGKEK